MSQAEREKLVEVMARAMCGSEGFNPDSGRATDGSPLWRQWIPQATVALAALEASGVRLVPVEATFQMYNATMPHCKQTNSAGDPPNPFRIWALMIAASPYAPEQKDETK